MRIYATFGGSKNVSPDEDYPHTQMIWDNVRDDSGNMMNNLQSNVTLLFSKSNLRVGNRYVIECENIDGVRMVRPSLIQKTYKNPKCDIIRKINGDYTFIKGKYKNKLLSDLKINEFDEINNYLLWVAETTNNEATTINVLDMLKIIHNEK